MKTGTFNILACPACRGKLQIAGAQSTTILDGVLSCARCGRKFQVKDGIPVFIQPSELIGLNRRITRLYDLFSWAYSTFSTLALAALGLKEEKARTMITDRLDPNGGKVLEVSIGTGTNLPYLVARKDVDEIYGLDISSGQLRQCRRLVKRHSWDVELFLGNAEALPFQDDTFTGVLHVGGINFFTDKRAAVQEMIRVAKPGAMILVADETEKGATWYERFIPGFLKSFERRRETIKPPFDLVPDEVLDKKVISLWKDWFYCIEFRKAG